MSTDKISFGEWGESIPDVPEDASTGGAFFSRGKKKAICGQGAHANRGSVRNGFCEMTMDQYFHEDGKPHKKTVTLELIVDDEHKGRVRFDIGMYYHGNE